MVWQSVKETVIIAINGMGTCLNKIMRKRDLRFKVEVKKVSFTMRQNGWYRDSVTKLWNKYSKEGFQIPLDKHQKAIHIGNKLKSQ